MNEYHIDQIPSPSFMAIYINLFIIFEEFELKLVIIIWPVILYDCETWSFTLREECRLKVFENKIQMRNGEWRRLNNEKLHSLYRSPSIVRVIKSRKLRWADHVARM